MIEIFPFGRRSSADTVIAGIDLTGKLFVVTGCNSGLGFETMSALSANGGLVIGLARSLADATAACRKTAPGCIPVACDLADLDSVAAAARTISALQRPLDAIVANAGIANLPTLQTHAGLEMQFVVNHIGHFALVNRLSDQVRNVTGRIVIVSSRASIDQAPPQGIMFDNLDGRLFYEPRVFYGQSKLANALFARELSRRLCSRGIAVNSAHPGAARGTGLHQNLNLRRKIALAAASPFLKSAPQGAATQTLLAASPRVSGITGEYWADCQVARGSALLDNRGLVERLWDVSQDFISRQDAGGAADFLRQAA